MPQFKDEKFDENLDELRRREEEALMQALAAKYGHAYINLNGVTINTEALRLVTEEEARAAELVCFQKNGNKVSVAVRNPEKQEAKKIISSFTERHYIVTVYTCSTSSLDYAYARYKDIKDAQANIKGVVSVIEQQVSEFSERTKTLADVAAKVTEISHADRAHQTSEALEVILGGAIALRASDIHVEPEEHAVRLRFRLDGVLIDVIDIPADLYKFLCSRLKLLSGLTLNRRDIPQDGRFTIKHGGHELDIRSSIIPGAYGESIVMRLLDPGSASRTIDDLGINSILKAVIAEEIKRPNGMIVTTGPTGSGKTTALYALLRFIHTPDIKIITLEDPIEYKIEGIVQTQVDGDYTFENGLRAILRQDPDVLLVGEIRDRDVAETAMHAALTGHLVFSTLHTNSAAGAFARLIDLGIDAETIGSAVNLVMGQRLLRKLCPVCRKARPLTDGEKKMIAEKLARFPKAATVTPETVVYESVGCSECNNTGFRGRVGVFEAIRVDQAVSDAARSDSREETIEKAASPQGIPTMQEDGLMKVLDGTTSFEELARVVDIQVELG